MYFVIDVSSVSSDLLQTAQSWANAGVCGGLCACAVSGTYNNEKTSILNVSQRVF